MSQFETTVGVALELPSADLVEQSRLKRAYRLVAAKQLLQLSALVESDPAAEIMCAIDTASLDKLPHWCLLDDVSLLQLQRITGAVFIVPALRRCIDGEVLNSWRSLLGAGLFDDIMKVGLELKLQGANSLPLASESILESNGASVLLSSIEDHPAKPLLVQRFAECPGSIPVQTALTVYTLAASIHQRYAADQPSAHAGSNVSESSDPVTIEAGVEAGTST